MFMTERLTPGEQAIYAAVFAAEVAPLFKPCGVPLHVIQQGADEDAWRRGQARSAAEVAWATVEQFREIELDLLKAFGTGDLVDMYRNMRGY